MWVNRSKYIPAKAMVALSILAALVFASTSWGQTGPSRFHRDLSRTDRALRVAIESAPAELGRELSASETVCGLADHAEQEGDVVRSAADWTTLSQMVRDLDLPSVKRTDSALSNADAGLHALRQRYSAGWTNRRKVAQLHTGVSGAREGIRMLRAALERVAGSFKSWPAHECQAATEGIAHGIARAQVAAARISLGMQPLWELT